MADRPISFCEHVQVRARSGMALVAVRADQRPPVQLTALGVQPGKLVAPSQPGGTAR